jgi:uncharacterized protein (DUF427 family)
MTATWNGAVLAESDRTVVVEGNHYFPPDSVRREHLQPSNTHTVCGWKGTASYDTVEVDGQRTWTPPGATRSRRRRPGRSPATWPSGRAWR